MAQQTSTSRNGPFQPRFVLSGDIFDRNRPGGAFRPRFDRSVRASLEVDIDRAVKEAKKARLRDEIWREEALPRFPAFDDLLEPANFDSVAAESFTLGTGRARRYLLKYFWCWWLWMAFTRSLHWTATNVLWAAKCSRPCLAAGAFRRVPPSPSILWFRRKVTPCCIVRCCGWFAPKVWIHSRN